MLLIPSDAWVSEDIEPSKIMAANLAKNHGIMAAIIHHRLSQRDGENKVRHPSHIEDIIKAFFNVTSSFNHLNLKDRKIVVSNYSTGARLSAFDNNKLLNQTKGVVSIDGIFDLESLAEQNSLYIRQFIEPPFVTDESDAWKKASPQYSVTSNSLNKISNALLPKYLLIDSAEDTVISSQQTIQFAEHLYDIVLKQFDFI